MWLPPPPVPVSAVEHELLGAESGFVRVLVEPGGDLLDQPRHEVAANVDLDHAGIGRYLDHADARVGGGM